MENESKNVPFRFHSCSLEGYFISYNLFLLIKDNPSLFMLFIYF
jgi:hypothetical protein